MEGGSRSPHPLFRAPPEHLLSKHPLRSCEARCCGAALVVVVRNPSISPHKTQNLLLILSTRSHPPPHFPPLAKNNTHGTRGECTSSQSDRRFHSPAGSEGKKRDCLTGADGRRILLKMRKQMKATNSFRREEGKNKKKTSAWCRAR